jgi:hypothetical protein
MCTTERTQSPSASSVNSDAGGGSPSQFCDPEDMKAKTGARAAAGASRLAVVGTASHRPARVEEAQEDELRILGVLRNALVGVLLKLCLVGKAEDLVLDDERCEVCSWTMRSRCCSSRSVRFFARPAEGSDHRPNTAGAMSLGYRSISQARKFAAHSMPGDDRTCSRTPGCRHRSPACCQASSAGADERFAQPVKRGTATVGCGVVVVVAL